MNFTFYKNIFEDICKKRRMSKGKEAFVCDSEISAQCARAYTQEFKCGKCGQTFGELHFLQKHIGGHLQEGVWFRNTDL